MTIAALIVFSVLLISWLAVPSERRQQRDDVGQPALELVPEGAAG
jgi:hypothetical protein